MKNTILFSFNLDPKLKEAASEKAKAEQLTLSVLIRRLLTDYVNGPSKFILNGQDPNQVIIKR